MDPLDRRTVRLLLQAIETLPPKDRDHVLTTLVGRAFATPGSAERPSELRGFGFDVGPDPAAGGQTMAPLLVRLPDGLHGRFRRWCVQHGFSMAAVARGLIERFLDEREASA